jgi:hypothetical protein
MAEKDEKNESSEAEEEPRENEGLDISKAPTSKYKIWQRHLMKQGIIPKHPGVVTIVGTQGSGKTTLVWNLLSKANFYGPSHESEATEGSELASRSKGKGYSKIAKPYFDHVFVFKGSDDDMYDSLEEAGLIEKIYVRPSPEDIQEVIDQQKSNIEEKDGDLSKVPRILFVFDDLVGDRKIMNSRPFNEAFFGERHLNASTWFLAQYINRIPKACRLQANWLIQFSPSAPELEVLMDMRPFEISKEAFREMITKATKPNGKKPNFFVMVKGQPVETRYRKNFDTLLQLRSIENEHQQKRMMRG